MTTDTDTDTGTAGTTVPHLTPARWAEAGRQLIRKALAEFAHERLLTPEPLADDLPGAPGPARPGETSYRVRADEGTVEYRFTASRLALDHWHIRPESISRHDASSQLPLDALDFFLDLRSSLGLSEDILPVYLEEISSTLAGTAYKLTKEPVTSPSWPAPVSRPSRPA